MPDKYVCDCGFTSETYVEKCPVCGEKIMKLDEFDDPEEGLGVEKYDELPDAEENEGEDAGIEKIPLRKAA